MFQRLMLFLKKSQMNLLDWQPTHQEIHHREGTTRHTASGALVSVAPTMAKVMVRGKEAAHVKHGEKVYYKTEGMARKKKGTVVAGSHEEGYRIQGVREGYNVRPEPVTAHREQIWTMDEHKTPVNESVRDGRQIAATESVRRAVNGMERLGMTESEVLQHPALVTPMKKTLQHIARQNGYNPNYMESNGVLHNDDPDANELYSEYAVAAIGAMRASTNNATEADIDEFKRFINGEATESNIAATIKRTGKTAALRHVIDNHDRNSSEQSYDTQAEDDYESGMQSIAARAATRPEHESHGAKLANLTAGIEEQLDALDDPIASAIIKMKFGLGRFDHGYKERDIAASLNRANLPAPNGEQWDAAQVKERMVSSLARLGTTRGARNLLDFLKSLNAHRDSVDPLIKSHIKQYTREDGTLVQEHDDKRTKKHQDILKHQNEHKEEVHSGAKLTHGKELISHLKERGWKEREVHQTREMDAHPGGKKEEMPEHEEIKAKNRDNSALQTAERAMKKMREAAAASDDPVAVLKNINTSRSNTYTAAIDDYREKLLNHYGHVLDRGKTATKLEKDGHSIILSKDGDKHTVHFAGGDPSKDKDAVTSIQGRREVQSVDTGNQEAAFVKGEGKSAKNSAYTAKLNPVKSTYSLVEAHQLTTSHTIQGHVNRAYPQEIQPRERERLSSQMQMANIMNDIKPELFGHSATAADGAPIVGKDGAVESGNGRTIALAEAYKRGKAEKYKEWLKENADQFGLKPEDVDKMEAPMLVRLRDEDDANTDRAEFAREANQSSNLGSSPAEQAWSDSERIDDSLLKKFTVDEDGEIYNDENMDFINGFLGKLGKNEAASLRDADGDPNKKAIERIQNAVFTKVYGSSMLTELQAESAKPKIRNILKALNSCVGDFAQIKGHDDLDVVPDMMEAIEYTLTHQSQSKAELEHTLRNAGALDFTGDTPTFKTDHAIDMILAISDRAGSRNRLENVFRSISNGIKNEVAERENPEVDMFSGPAEPKSKEQVVKQALDKVNRSDDNVQKSRRNGLTHLLIKTYGGSNGGSDRRTEVRKEVGHVQKSIGGRRQDGCEGRKKGGISKSQGSSDGSREEGKAGGNGQGISQTGSAELTKSHVSAYDRTTKSGALAHIDAHEDHRVKRYAIKLARTKNSHELHKLRQERFAHLPHWGSIDEHTKQRILDAEDEVHGEHKHWEQWKDDHMPAKPAKGKEKKEPMADRLQGDHSGLLQARLFKGRLIGITHLLQKSQIANHAGYVLRTVTQSDGSQTRRWFRIGSPESMQSTGETHRGVLAAAMRGVIKPELPDTSESNRGCNRRISMLWAKAMDGDMDAVANFSTSRTRANYCAVDDYKQALLAAANRDRSIPVQHVGQAPAPATVTGGNMTNTALVSAQIKINRLHEAANSDDPVPAILAISTSRSNGYTRAADDYRTLLLRHFGCNSDGTEIAGFSPESGTPMPVAPVTDPTIAATPTPRQPRASQPTATIINPVQGSANPLNMTEAQLGFVPRPNYPLGTHTIRREGAENNGVLIPYPSDHLRDLARRYLAQDTSLQTRARQYQEGTWRPATPPTPEARAQTEAEQRRAAAELQQRQTEMARMREVAQNFNAKINAQADFKPKNQVGANITRYEINSTENAHIERTFGVPIDAVKNLAATMIADYGGNIMFTATIEKSYSDAAYIKFYGSDGTDIKRLFTREGDKLRVYHSIFVANTGGTGSGKALLRASMGAYKVLGIDNVTVSANIDVGGYAWARFGYKPTDWRYIKTRIERNLTALEDGTHHTEVRKKGETNKNTIHFPKLPKATVDRVTKILTDGADDPYTLWKISDMKAGGREVGKELLLGTRWDGIISLKDKKAMKRLTQYVNS